MPPKGDERPEVGAEPRSAERSRSEGAARVLEEHKCQFIQQRGELLSIPLGHLERKDR